MAQHQQPAEPDLRVYYMYNRLYDGNQLSFMPFEDLFDCMLNALLIQSNLLKNNFLYKFRSKNTEFILSVSSSSRTSKLELTLRTVIVHHQLKHQCMKHAKGQIGGFYNAQSHNCRRLPDIAFVSITAQCHQRQQQQKRRT